MCQTLNLQIIICFVCPNRSYSDWGLSVSSMLGGLFLRWVFIHLSFTRKLLVIGMPSFMIKIKSKYNNGTKLPHDCCWYGRYPWIRLAMDCVCWWRGSKTLPFCLGTTYNIYSMEDTEISWLLCWQWKHTAQNYIHLCFKNFELWHLCKSLLPSTKGLSIYSYCWVIIFL